MSWIVLSILSAVILGFYDLAKKNALRENAVLPVLFFGILTSGLVWIPFIAWSAISPGSYPAKDFLVDSLSPHQHGLLFLKSCLVAFSWIFGYFSLKHLPLSIAAPIRSTSPLWTILLAVTFMGESPSAWQWVGIGIVLSAFYAFSLVGKLESIEFHRNKWVLFMVAATLLGAVSSIYDKYLLQEAAIRPASVQAWFSVYLIVVMLPFMVLWRKGVWQTGEFFWRWSIPMIGILLLAADFLYFTAISQEGALISVISPIRRAAVVIPFLGGILLHKEKNFRPKAICIVALLAGVILIQLKSMP
tara:strand:- start:323 stop:1231 length:909 start_codon:yes stop_codon:yes gene_type:complete